MPNREAIASVNGWVGAYLIALLAVAFLTEPGSGLARQDGHQGELVRVRGPEIW
jgi:hypothetical protein